MSERLVADILCNKVSDLIVYGVHQPGKHTTDHRRRACPKEQTADSDHIHVSAAHSQVDSVTDKDRNIQGQKNGDGGKNDRERHKEFVFSHTLKYFLEGSLLFHFASPPV